MLLAEMSLFEIISNATYGALAGVALWGLYCIVIVWSRVNQKRFKSEEQQDFFMDDVEQMLNAAESAEEPTMPDSSTLPAFRFQGVTKRGMASH